MATVKDTATSHDAMALMWIGMINNDLSAVRFVDQRSIALLLITTIVAVREKLPVVNVFVV